VLSLVRILFASRRLARQFIAARQVCNGLMKLAKARAAIRSYKFTSG